MITHNASPAFAEHALKVVEGVLAKHPEPTNLGVNFAPGVLKTDCKCLLENVRFAARRHRVLMAAGDLDAAYQYAYTGVRWSALDFIRTYTGDTGEGSDYNRLRNAPTMMERGCSCDYDLAQGCERRLTGGGHCESEPLVLAAPMTDAFDGAKAALHTLLEALDPSTTRGGRACTVVGAMIDALDGYQRSEYPYLRG